MPPVEREGVREDVRTVDTTVPAIAGIFLSAFDSDDECDNSELDASDAEPARASTDIEVMLQRIKALYSLKFPLRPTSTML